MITSVTIASGSSTANFKYRDSVAGSPTVTVATTGLTSGTQVETILAEQPAAGPDPRGADRRCRDERHHADVHVELGDRPRR